MLWSKAKRKKPSSFKNYFFTHIDKLEKFFTITLGSVCITAFLLHLDFNYLEACLYDWRMSHGIQAQANSEIVLIAIDETTTDALDEFSPLPLNHHALFLEKVKSYRPKAVGYIVDMNHVHQANPNLIQKSWGTRFVNAANSLEKQGVAFLLGTPFDVRGEIPPPGILHRVPHAVAVVHRDGNVFSEDKVTRRALLTLYDRPAFHLELARKLGALGENELPSGSFYVPEADGSYFFFKYHGSTALSRSDPKPMPYKTYSFSDVLANRVPFSALQNHIVLVSTLSADDSTDFALTPYSKAPFSNPKLVVHANILDSVLQKSGIQLAPKLVNYFTTFAVTVVVFWWITTSTPLYGVFATISLALVFAFINHMLFQLKGVWIRESQPLLGLFIGYYLAVPYRLIREYEEKWNIQRKHELLTQVEEMKTNFMSLVTHDLKTPVARIQGLAEVLRRNSTDYLTHRDRQAVNNILLSTEELNRFISMILELSRVDSDHIQMNLESKDINQLIERSIERFQAQAKEKGIQIISHLEPLFPTRIDPSLISKVLCNLIDNALKYSPPESEISIESKEIAEWIVISIRDQGIGLSSEEKEHLFTRFYRAKNDATASVSGTGVGLYLTKYFIEKHNGRVEVESCKNNGSTFRIFIPVQDLSKNPDLIEKSKKTKISPQRKTKLKQKGDRYVQSSSC